MRVYFDAAPMIYLVEEIAPWHAAIEARFTTGQDRIVISDLTRMECLVKPLRNGDTTRIQDHHAFHAAAEYVPMPPAVFDRAAELRARSRGKFKTADALHLAAAIEAGCDSFLTNDAALLACTDIRVELL